jgi:hypothetical protein
MTARLAMVEARSADQAVHRSLSLRIEANELRRDIGKARFLIEQVRRRFPGVHFGGESGVAASR